jgi:predicted nucleotidyltransferase
MTYLQKIDDERKQRCESLRQEARSRLRQCLGELLPGRFVLVFGSLTRPGEFHEDSDIDLALASEPLPMSVFGLIGELEERLGRPVDVVLLDQCRFREKLLREGETWIS